jgi:spermidine/putrescine transport system ATP-binding protein
VALARALAPKPRVLLLDEPLSALDLKLRKQMQSELRRLRGETGISFVLVTHDQEEALAMSDRIAVMQGGEVLQVGTPRDIYDNPASRFVADFIGESNLISGAVLGRNEGVTIAVRPEQMSLSSKGHGRLDGTVTAVTFLGLDTVYEVALDEGTQLRARSRNGGDVAPGDIVGLDWPAAAERVLTR